jgi:hypothetical protein
MPGLIADNPREVARSVAATVVGDDPVDVVDAMDGEPDLARARNAAAVAPFSSASGSV